MFPTMDGGRALPEARPASLYDAPEFGGETTMRAKVIRELIDEIRRLRQDLQRRASDGRRSRS
jgi:hypothetical protein